MSNGLQFTVLSALHVDYLYFSMQTFCFVFISVQNGLIVIRILIH